MPLFGFTCSECDEDFEELVRSSSAVDEVVCPECGSGKVEKQLSLVAAPARSKGASSFSSGPACAPGGV